LRKLLAKVWWLPFLGTRCICSYLGFIWQYDSCYGASYDTIRYDRRV